MTSSDKDATEPQVVLDKEMLVSGKTVQPYWKRVIQTAAIAGFWS